MKPLELKVITAGQNRKTGLWEARCRPCKLTLASTYSQDVFEDLERHTATAFHAAEVLLWRHHLERAA